MLATKHRIKVHVVLCNLDGGKYKIHLLATDHRLISFVCSVQAEYNDDFPEPLTVHEAVEWLNEDPYYRGYYAEKFIDCWLYEGTDITLEPETLLEIN